MSHYVFGPVPSRRLGRSLGIDLVPFKTCTYNCIYCQLGATTNLTLERKEWVPFDKVMEEAREKIRSADGIDYITFSGSGEPTLHSRIGEMIRELKRLSSIPVAVLTNGSLLWQQEVRNDLLEADLVIPSLDAPDRGLFRHVNRPHADLAFDHVVEGLIKFRERYSGKIWLEVFLLSGITGMESEVKRIAGLARTVRPDLVQLMTVTRPAPMDFVEPVSSEDMNRFVRLFDVPTVAVPALSSIARNVLSKAGSEEILRLLERRPCTIEDIALGLGIPPAEAEKYVADLDAHGQLKRKRSKDATYFTADPT
jgi:wyosine [tRNA(Phe)-imidazoG37] synthetase (radical SAM superfamily)